QQAGLAPRPDMQDEGALALDAHVSNRRPCRGLLLAVAEGLERGLVVGPALAHAHPGLQEHLAPEQPLHLLARLAADLAQAGAGLADHDRLLAFTFDPDHRTDAQQRTVLGEALDLHRSEE